MKKQDEDDGARRRRRRRSKTKEQGEDEIAIAAVATAVLPVASEAMAPLKCYYRPTASLQLNNKRNTKYNITVT